MNNYLVREAVRVFVNLHIGWGRRFYNQNQLADFLSVRPATVSSWVNAKSDIDFFTFLRISQAFSVDGKNLDPKIIGEFLSILQNQIDKSGPR